MEYSDITDFEGTANQWIPGFVLKVEAVGAPHFWLYLSVTDDMTLRRLDTFLRKLWLECCGHQSDFVTSDSQIVFGKNRKIRDVYETNGGHLLHTYDFGSSTFLNIDIQGITIRRPSEAKIGLMARNSSNNFPCSSCGKTASQECTYCNWSDMGKLCAKCASNHNCEPGENKEEYIIPHLGNSPRFGVCGYYQSD